MPKLKINGINIEVEAGATVLEAAQFLGVPLPTLCHDDGLRAAGAGSLCLVEVSVDGGKGRTKPPKSQRTRVWRRFRVCATPLC